MLQELNSRLEALSFCKMRMFQDSSGSVWLEDLGVGTSTAPVKIGTLSDAKGYVEALEKEERMVAVMS